MGFKRPLVQIQSLGPAKGSQTAPLFCILIYTDNDSVMHGPRAGIYPRLVFKPNMFSRLLHDVLPYFRPEALEVGGHGDGETDALALGEAGEPIEELDGLGLRVAVEELMEVVDEYVRNVVIAGAQAADEALMNSKVPIW